MEVAWSLLPPSRPEGGAILRDALVLHWKVFHTPAVVQQEAEQAEQDEGHASQDSQQEHGVYFALPHGGSMLSQMSLSAFEWEHNSSSSSAAGRGTETVIGSFTCSSTPSLANSFLLSSVPDSAWPHFLHRVCYQPPVRASPVPLPLRTCRWGKCWMCEGELATRSCGQLGTTMTDLVRVQPECSRLHLKTERCTK
ncbi:hypothetical protein EYF80_014068 [Liparis tanakae]|uniref:Uncharacterized protein n=1 Tax=Liparis tanakae TaxID=230148 RepID=A0A4Z2IDS3_9TELE|nr:hypothetical protein EYF80_014068 [Liparis tanakae]